MWWASRRVRALACQWRSRQLRGRWILWSLLTILLCGSSALAQLPSDAPKLPERPARLWQALIDHDWESLACVDWEVVREYPPVEALLQTGDPEVIRGVPVLGALGSLVAVRPVLQSNLARGLWVEAQDPLVTTPYFIWLQTGMSRQQEREWLRRSGWWNLRTRQQLHWEDFFAAPLDTAVERRVQEEGPGSDQDDPEKREAHAWWRQWRAGIRLDDWLMLDRPQGGLPWDWKLASPPAVPELRKLLPFPFWEMAQPLDGAVARIVINLPGKAGEGSNAGEGGEAGGDDLGKEIEATRRRIRLLEDPDVQGLLREMNDMLVNIWMEGDSLRLELQTEAGGGGADPSLVADVLAVTVRFMALMNAWASPALARELAGTSIERKGDRVVASLTLSEASLMEAVDRIVERRRRLRELRKRMKLLKAQILEDGAADGG